MRRPSTSVQNRPVAISGADALWLDLPGSPPPIVLAVLTLKDTPKRQNILDLPVQVAALPPFARRPVRTSFGWRWEPLGSPPKVVVHNNATLDDVIAAPVTVEIPWRLHLVVPDNGPTLLVLQVHHVLGDGATLVGALLELAGLPQKRKTVQSDFRERLLIPAAALRLFRVNEPRRYPPQNLNTSSVDASSPCASAATLTILDSSALDVPAAPDQLAAPDAPAAGLTSQELGPYPLAELLTKTREQKVTLNHLLLATVGAATELVLGPGRHALVPVARHRATGPGNDFGLIFLALPSGDSRKRLYRARQDARRAARSGESAFTAGCVSLAGLLPGKVGSWLRYQGVRLVSSRASVVLSNVSGPAEKVKVAGVQVTGLSFVAPHVGTLPFSVGLVSYADQVGIRITARNQTDLEKFCLVLDAELRTFLDTQ